jgi:hypothetical protein
MDILKYVILRVMKALHLLTMRLTTTTTTTTTTATYFKYLSKLNLSPMKNFSDWSRNRKEDTPSI